MDLEPEGELQGKTDTHTRMLFRIIRMDEVMGEERRKSPELSHGKHQPLEMGGEVAARDWGAGRGWQEEWEGTISETYDPSLLWFLLIKSEVFPPCARLCPLWSVSAPTPIQVSSCYSQPQSLSFGPCNGLLASPWKTQSQNPNPVLGVTPILLKFYFLLIQVASLVIVCPSILFLSEIVF